VAAIRCSIVLLGVEREMSQLLTVVITGASAGVGRATTHYFAQQGAQLGLIARDRGALEQTKQEAQRMGAAAVAVVPADVADAAKILEAAAEIERQLGSIDVWINNAMVTVFGPLWSLTAEEYRRVTEVTYLGAVHGTMAALQSMRRRNRGHIIQVGSALAYRGIPLQAAYCGAKHAIRGMTDSLRSELLHAGSDVRITVMELPAVNTPQFDWARTHMPRQPRPVAPIMQPEVVAKAIGRAVRKPAREYWIGWSTAKVVLGNMLLPSFLDRFLARHGITAQEAPNPAASDRQDNLMHPISNLHRTRGRFGAEARADAAIMSGSTGRWHPSCSARWLASVSAC
jgi:short-subunit dehydrogenase